MDDTLATLKLLGGIPPGWIMTRMWSSGVAGQDTTPPMLVARTKGL
jgi:hypothetical protein